MPDNIVETSRLYKFLLVDDHAVVRNGVRYMLAEFYKASQIDEAENEPQALEKIQSEDYDLVFLDINIPKTNTHELLKFMLAQNPTLKVLIFSMNPEKFHAKRYLEIGAKGFLSKDAPIDEIRRAIDMILNSKTYYSGDLMDALVQEKFLNKSNNPFEKLSPREFQIVNLLLEGKSLSEISTILGIHTSTTGTHKAKIFEKLNVNNLVELIELTKMYT